MAKKKSSAKKKSVEQATTPDWQQPIRDRQAKELQAKKDAQEKREAAIAKELKTPLSTEEIAEMVQLEKQANQGKDQPHPTDMARLGRMRIRAEL